ncbi:MAG: murein hydrolase activator EnvC family protein [Thermoanaerobaculaceae bacterium]
MGVTSEPLWEVQWHGGATGRLRRFYITKKKLRWLAGLGAFGLILVLSLIGALPIGIQGYVQRLTVKAVRQENQQLMKKREALLEEAQEMAQEVAGRLNRGLRLAWALGAKTPVLPSELARDSAEERLVSWLLAESQKLVELAESLASAPGPPCGLGALPSGWPLDTPQAVPVGLFGVLVSPFTGQEEPHLGLRIVAPPGTRVLAAGNGRVAFQGKPRERKTNQWTKLGIVVVLEHGAGVWSVYGHLGAVQVRTGQTVRRGEVIGSVGSTGWTRVPALYFEVRWPVGQVPVPVDPLLLQVGLPLPELEARLADPTGGIGENAPPLSMLVGGAYSFR